MVVKEMVEKEVPMFKYHCLNPIAKVGLDGLPKEYVKTEDIGKRTAFL